MAIHIVKRYTVVSEDYPKSQRRRRAIGNRHIIYDSYIELQILFPLDQRRLNRLDLPLQQRATRAHHRDT